MDDKLTDLILQQGELSSRQFDVALRMAGDNRAAIYRLARALHKVPGIDVAEIEGIIGDLEGFDAQILSEFGTPT